VDLAEALLRQDGAAQARDLLAAALPVLDRVYGAEYASTRQARDLLTRVR
jgi:hypothetical protein